MADRTEQPARENARRTAPALSWRVIALVAGDMVSFLVFAAVGRYQHGETSGLSAATEVALTAIPFALGWLIVSPWIGAYRRNMTSDAWRMLARTELAWLVSFPVAFILRLALDPQPLTPAQIATFGLVVLCANAVFLGVWRLAFASVEGWLARRG